MEHIVIMPVSLIEREELENEMWGTKYKNKEEFLDSLHNSAKTELLILSVSEFCVYCNDELFVAEENWIFPIELEETC